MKPPRLADQMRIRCRLPCRFGVCIALGATIVAALTLSAPAQSKADPASWILWRAAPIPFPNEMTPTVPELLESGPVIDFHPDGSDLTILIPDQLGTNYDDAALHQTVKLITAKTRKATITTPARLTAADRQRHLLVLGTLKRNAFAREVLGAAAGNFTAGLKPGGYHLQPLPNPFAAAKRLILALGSDDAGAWSAALVLAHAIHPQAERLGPLRNWPVKLPEGCYWAPFEARYTLDRDAVEMPAAPYPPPRPPRVPFGIRIWGSPMPTLESYQRLVRALKPSGLNTLVVQSGGWVDLPDAPGIFTKAVDLAWREGLFTILYAGNEEKAHRPAPLTKNHQAVVLATKDHPGLLGWHLYNQLAATLTPGERALVKEQTGWLRSVSPKPIAMEIVWGHNSIAAPADKVQLISDLKSWGVQHIPTDYAPIGGWANQPILSRWEGRLLQLDPLGVGREAVLQAHVPFLEPTVPRREELRQQFWWAVAGDAQGYCFETAYLFTHFSVRGLLGWNLTPLPDGRFNEVRELAGTMKKLEAVLCASRRATDAETGASKLRILPSEEPTALRLRVAEAGGWFALLINEDLDHAATATVATDDGQTAYDVTDALTSRSRGQLDTQRQMRVEIPAGGGACLQLKPVAQTTR